MESFQVSLFGLGASLREGKFCSDLPHSTFSEHFTTTPETLAKQGISGQNKEIDNNDKSTICMPRQDKGVDCKSSQNVAVSGQITADGKEKYYGMTTNDGVETVKLKAFDIMMPLQKCRCVYF